MRPLESNHWYGRDGSPAYSQTTKAGGERPTDLRDARKQGLVPSVTTVLSVLAKPALVDWMVDQGIMAALTLKRRDMESDAAFLERVRADGRAQAAAAAEEGTRIHDAIECAYRGKLYPTKYEPHVSAVQVELAAAYPSVTDWVPEAHFCHGYGFGGKVDLHSPSTGIVVDFKGKDGDFSNGKRLAYDQHYQLGGYAFGLRLEPSEGANLFVSRTHPGAVKLHRWTPDEMDDGRAVFQASLALWKLLKRYDPSFPEEARTA